MPHEKKTSTASIDDPSPDVKKPPILSVISRSQQEPYEGEDNTSTPIASPTLTRVSEAKTYNGYQNQYSSECGYNMNTEERMVGHILDNCKCIIEIIEGATQDHANATVNSLSEINDKCQRIVVEMIKEGTKDHDNATLDLASETVQHAAFEQVTPITFTPNEKTTASIDEALGAEKTPVLSQQEPYEREVNFQSWSTKAMSPPFTFLMSNEEREGNSKSWSAKTMTPFTFMSNEKNTGLIDEASGTKKPSALSAISGLEHTTNSSTSTSSASNPVNSTNEQQEGQGYLINGRIQDKRRKQINKMPSVFTSSMETSQNDNVRRAMSATASIPVSSPMPASAFLDNNGEYYGYGGCVCSRYTYCIQAYESKCSGPPEHEQKKYNPTR